MKSHIFVGALILVAASCENVWAADASPQPTTSPTNSGKISANPANNTELAQFVKARAAVSANIAAFNALVSNGKSGPSAKKLKALADEIGQQANTIFEYAKSTNNTAAQKLASQLIIDDDITGRKSAQQAIARRLMELDAQLALLAPAVHR